MAEKNNLVGFINNVLGTEYAHLTKLYQLTTKTACAGVFVKRGKIVDAAPIHKWLVGAKLLDAMRDLFWRGEFIWCELIGEE